MFIFFDYSFSSEMYNNLIIDYYLVFFFIKGSGINNIILIIF